MRDTNRKGDTNLRCSNIEVNFKIPVRVNELDGNGNVYTEEVIMNACKNASGLPILQRNVKGVEIVVGVAESVTYKDGHICVKGHSFYGGTEEQVEFNALNQIHKMNITGFSICE